MKLKRKNIKRNWISIEEKVAMLDRLNPGGKIKDISIF